MKAINTNPSTLRVPTFLLGLLLFRLLSPLPCFATPPPTFITQPVSQGVPLNGTVSFSTTVNSSTTASYQWYKNGSPISYAIFSFHYVFNAQTNDQANYTVKVTNLGGSVTSSNAALTILLPAGITTQPQNQTVTQGANTSFSVVANGTAPFTYQWRFNSQDLPGATSATLPLSNVQPADVGNYSVIVSNALGSTTSAGASLNVNVPATITLQPQSQRVTPGQSVGFSVEATGTGSLNYQWRFNGVNLANATSHTLSLSNVQATNAGSYSVRVTNAFGSVTSAVATLALNLPPTITTQPQSQLVVPGQTATFSVGATGMAPFSYQWKFKGTNLAGATDSTLLLNNVQTNLAGNYCAVVMNALGSATSAVATLSIAPPARPATLWLNTQGPTTDAGVSPISWSSNHIVSFDAPGLSYGSNTTFGTFRLEHGFNPPPQIREFYHVNSSIYVGNAGTGYQLLPGDLLVVFNVLSATTFGTVTNVLRSDVLLYRPAAGRDYANGTYSMLLNAPLNNGAICNVHAISLVEQDTLIGNTVIPKGTFLVARSPATNHMNLYTYRPTSVGRGTTTSSAGTLLLDGSKLGNASAKVKGVDLIESPVLIGGKYLKTGQLLMTLDLMATLNPATQNITVQPTDAFILDVTATQQDPTPNTLATVTPFLDGSSVGLDDALANETVMSFSLVDWANLVPILMSQPTNQTVASGGSTAFSVVAKGGSSTLAYQWTLGGAALPGATNAALSRTNVKASDEGNYAVVVSNFAGSVTSAVATLTVLLPASIATQPLSQTVAKGTNVALLVVASGTGPIGYRWRFNGATLPGATNATLNLSNVQTNNAGNYTVVVSNAWGSATSAVATLSVIVPPAIVTPPQPQTVAMGQSASFSVAATGTGPLSYQWCFSGTPLAGATNATLLLTNVRGPNEGSYMVLVTNTWGFVANASASLTMTYPNITLSADTGAGMGMTPGGFRFQFSVPAGVTYVILASTDLATWSPIATNVAASTSAVFTDTKAANYSQRLYKVMLP